MKKTIIVIAVTVLAVVGIFAIMGVSASNREISLRSKVTAQKQVCEAYYDKLWKVISQKVQVTDQYKNAFKEIYPQLIEGRYGNDKGGSLMKFVQESNPNFDVSLYKDLMQSIEAERAGFFMEQKKLTDIANEHRICKSTWPASMFIGGRSDVEITIVSSTKTKGVMQSGKEDDVDLYKNDKK